MKDALERLYARRTFGTKLGLDVEQAFLQRMGNPERHYGIIHVAGTNGKGSVCAFLDSIIRAAGFKVGLYTSPHLVRFNERISVDGRFIGDDELGDLVAETETLASAVAGELGREPTFFECATAMALEYFRRQDVQIAVLETGMGGRLDATNVVTPLLSVITRISVEHTTYLGSDIETIAAEKCGVIKPGRPVVCGMMDEQAASVVRRVARERHAMLVDVTENVAVKLISGDLSGQKVGIETGNTSYGTLNLPLLGRHQLENLATAVAAVEFLGRISGMNIREEDVRTGVSNVRWPGRFHVLAADPPLILDGAHNPGAAKALADTLTCRSAIPMARRPLGLIVGMCGEKDLKGFLTPFGKLVKKMWAVPIKSDRSMPPAQIASVGKGMGWGVCETALPVALDEAKTWARQNGGAVCVTGSLFLVGEVLSTRGETAEFHP